MFTRIQICFATVLMCSISTAGADSTNLSRHWHTHLWVWEHSDVEVNVYHLPNGTIRGVGRFSNGLQTVDRKYALVIVVENTEGAAWQMVINERVPPTGVGGTQVKWRTDEMAITGQVLKVYAKADILNEQSGVIGISQKCEFGPEGTKCKLPKPIYDKEKGIVQNTFRAATEKNRSIYVQASNPKFGTQSGPDIGPSVTQTQGQLLSIARH